MTKNISIVAGALLGGALGVQVLFRGLAWSLLASLFGPPMAVVIAGMLTVMAAGLGVWLALKFTEQI